MAYSPISGILPQLAKNAGGAAAGGYYLKGYIAGTTTPLSMGTDTVPTALLAKAKLNSRGEPISNDADEDSVFIPHFENEYKLALYLTAADADANNTSAALWVVTSSSGLISLAARVSEIEGTNVTDTFFSGTVSILTASSLLPGITARTGGYHSIGDMGAAEYLVKTPAQASADGDVIDGYGNHTLANGNIAVLLSQRNNLNYGCRSDGSSNDTAALQALDAAGGGDILKGIVRVQANISLVSDYSFRDGGIIAPDSAFTITWKGNIQAGDFKIFDGLFKLTKIHRVHEIRITWFGAKSSDLSTDMGDLALANANAKAIRQANLMTQLGIPTGVYITPILRIPTGLFLVDDDDNDGKIIDCGAYATILGEGWSSVLRPVNNGKAFSVIKCDTNDAGNIIIDDLQIYGEASLQVNTQHGIDMSPPLGPIIYSYIGQGVHIKEMKGNGIRVTGAGMDNSMIEARLVRDSSLHNLLVTGCDRLTVQGGIYRTAKAGNPGALFDGVGCLSAIIRNNQFDENNGSGLVIANVTGRFDIDNNRCSTNFTGSGIFIDRCNNTQLNNNQCEANNLHGIVADTCSNIQLNNNHLRSNGQYGIVIGATSNSHIHNNMCLTNSATTTNTYDGINLQSNSDNNSVQGNTVRGTGHRYGIAINTTDCNANLVTNNDLLGSGTTGSLFDNGVGTVTVSGNRL